MMITRFRTLQQRGDTIMEVMICIAILGFVLAAAFALASRNQTSARQSQERSEALQIADSQLELLKTYAGRNKLPAATHTHFCMNADATDVIDFPTASGPPANAADDTNPDVYPNACRQGTDQRYWVAIWAPSVADDLGAQPGVYAVTVRWESAGGDIPREETNIFYAVNDASLPTYADITAPPPPVGPAVGLLTADNDISGSGTYVQWSTEETATSCTLDATPGPFAQVTLTLNGSKEGSYSSALNTTQRYTVVCYNGATAGPSKSVVFNPPPPSCAPAGSPITIQEPTSGTTTNSETITLRICFPPDKRNNSILYTAHGTNLTSQSIPGSAINSTTGIYQTNVVLNQGTGLYEFQVDMPGKGTSAIVPITITAGTD